MKKTSARLDVLYKGKHLHFVKRHGWEFAHRPTVTGIVAIIAVNPAGQVLLVEQFRPPVDARVIEIPSGLAGDVRGAERERLLSAAKRELIEETGYQARTWTRLFAGPPSAGVSSEVVTFFRATDLRRTGKGGGVEHENIIVHEVPLAHVDGWLRRKTAKGMLIDPKVYAGLCWARQ